MQKAEEVKRLLRLDRYWRSEVVESLLARSDEVVVFDPSLGFEIAQAAETLVRRIPRPAPDLIAHAQCSVAVGLRHLGRLPESTRWFASANQSALLASARIRAMVARQRAALLLAIGEVDEALSLAQWAVGTDRTSGVAPSISLIVEGSVHRACGRHGAAVEAFAEVLATESPKKPAYLLAIQCLGFVLAEASRTAEEIVRARRILNTVRERIKGVRDTPVRYRVCWGEAILHRRLEEFRPALELLQRARKGFQRLGMAHDFALISVELASLHLDMGHERQAQTLLGQSTKILATLGNPELADTFRDARANPDPRAAVATLQQRLVRPPGPA